MKTFRYHFALLTVILMAMVTNVQAQDDERALGAAADTIIRTETRDYIVNRIVESVYQSHPTASLATRIAKAYYNYNEDSETGIRNFHKNDTTHAFLFIRRAIELDPKYAGAYVLASDILDYDRQDEEAMRWLDEGIKHNPKDSSLYLAQAKLLAFKDENAAVAKLEELRKQDPDFPVDLHLGRLYFKLFGRGGTAEQRGEFIEKMVSYYDKYFDIDKGKMTEGDLGALATYLVFLNRSDRAYEVASYGLPLFPEDFALNQSYFYSLLGAKKYGEAIIAAKKMFAVADSTKLQPIHYLRYGEALNGDKQYDMAIEQYEKVIAMPDASEANIRTAYNHIATTMGDQANGYIKAEDYQAAVNIYSKFVDERKKIGKLDASILSMYAGVYKSWAAKKTGQEQEDLFDKADKIYAEMGELFPQFDDIAMNNRMQIKLTLDPEWTGLAVPYAEKLVSLILAKGDLNDGQKTRLLSGYWTLCYFNARQGGPHKKAAIEYARKVLAINPDFSGAQKILEIFKAN